MSACQSGTDKEPSAYLALVAAIWNMDPLTICYIKRLQQKKPFASALSQLPVRTVDHEGFYSAADLVGCLTGLSDPDCAWLDSWILRVDFIAERCALDPDLKRDPKHLFL